MEKHNRLYLNVVVFQNKLVLLLNYYISFGYHTLIIYDVLIIWICKSNTNCHYKYSLRELKTIKVQKKVDVNLKDCNHQPHAISSLVDDEIERGRGR